MTLASPAPPVPPTPTWTTYIVACADSTYYTGISNDLTKRLAKHNANQGAAYTKGRGPVKLCYTEQFETRGAASQREAAIKKLTREQKIALIKQNPC